MYYSSYTHKAGHVYPRLDIQTMGNTRALYLTIQDCDTICKEADTLTVYIDQHDSAMHHKSAAKVKGIPVHCIELSCECVRVLVD